MPDLRAASAIARFSVWESRRLNLSIIAMFPRITVSFP
jgi:hypothetical protein